tara:strand:- start:887 stop:1042 length:156 start_codon:yes stop_codon:yes gene_type:complete
MIEALDVLDHRLRAFAVPVEFGYRTSDIQFTAHLRLHAHKIRREIVFRRFE